MKFFLSFLQGKPGHPIPAYNFWQDYIKNGLEESGHAWSECPEVDWAQGLVEQPVAALQKWKEETWSKTIAHLKENPSDVFLSYLYPIQIDESAINTIQDMGIPCINFFCDHVRQFRQIPAEFSCFDLNWVPEYQAVAMYQKAKLKYIHLPMPAWVKPELRMPGKDSIQQISFIGSKDIQRKELFDQVFELSPSLPLHLYGAGWKDMHYQKPAGKKQNKLLNQAAFIKEHGLSAYARKLSQRSLPIGTKNIPQDHIHPLISDLEYTHLSRNSSVTLGVNRYPSYHFPLDRPDSYSRLRDIEAPMMGACYLTEYTLGLDVLYDIGKEILAYNSPAELVEISNRLLSDHKLRETLRSAGQKKALGEHSIPESIRKIKDAL